MEFHAFVRSYIKCNREIWVLHCLTSPGMLPGKGAKGTVNGNDDVRTSGQGEEGRGGGGGQTGDGGFVRKGGALRTTGWWNPPERSLVLFQRPATVGTASPRGICLEMALTLGSSFLELGVLCVVPARYQQSQYSKPVLEDKLPFGRINRGTLSFFLLTCIDFVLFCFLLTGDTKKAKHLHSYSLEK